MQHYDFQIQYHSDFGVVPTRGTEGSVGFDISLPEPAGALFMPYNSRRVINTGLTFIPPFKCFVLAVLRSSSRKKCLRLSNTLGIIDPDFSGPEDTIQIDLTRTPKADLGLGVWKPEYGSLSEYSQELLKAEGLDPTTQTKYLVDPQTSHVHIFAELPNTYKVFDAGERFCQLIFIPWHLPELVQTLRPKPSVIASRGGLGSTGTI